MDFDPVTSDPPSVQYGRRSSTRQLLIPSGGERMLGWMLVAPGKGPKPAALLLHGFPGHETNLDIAHALRRAGVSSVIFHYRGSWGSKGSFSFQNMVEDARNAMDFLKDNSDMFGLSKEQLFLIGYSMGGWASFMAAKDRRDLKGVAWLAGFNLGLVRDYIILGDRNRKVIQKGFAECMPPLNGCTPEELVKSVMENAEEWNVLNHVPGLAEHKLLIVGGKKDQISQSRYHFEPLVKALERSRAKDLTVKEIDSDHNFSGCRIELTRTVVDWILEAI